jgi:hypothetical protein
VIRAALTTNCRSGVRKSVGAHPQPPRHRVPRCGLRRARFPDRGARCPGRAAERSIVPTLACKANRCEEPV